MRLRPAFALGVVIATSGVVGVFAAQPDKASGTITIDGKPTSLTHVVRTTKPNPFDEQVRDTVIVLSNRPLTAPEAADEAALLARAERGEIVTMAVRYDSRPGRWKLFNVSVAHQGLDEMTLLPDVVFEHTFTSGAGTLTMAARKFRGHTYASAVAFAVVMPVETAVSAPTAPAGLPPPSRTEADRKAASGLLIQALQEGDERRALGIVRLGIDPNVRDAKMNIPLINWAVLMCQPPIVKALAELKVDVTHQRLPGMTLLAEAEAACPDAVPFLKAAGAK